MDIESWCTTDRGKKRESNQDSFLVNQELGLYIVADGMGGHSGGEVASSLAVSTVEEFIKKNKKSAHSPRELLTMAYEKACQTIYDTAEQNLSLKGMGTTMVAAYKVGDSLYMANVGDSRAYMYRRPYIWQITEDHSLMNEQIRAGLITEEQAQHMAGRNVITRSVGFEREIQVDIFERPIMRDDHFLLCSDGLSGLVTDKLIGDIINTCRPYDVTKICVQKALDNGGTDNVTVLYLRTY